MNNKQHTISKSVTLSGVGLHTGVVANMTFLPAAANHGIKFQRVDLPGQPIADADVDYVVDTSAEQRLSTMVPVSTPLSTF